MKAAPGTLLFDTNPVKEKPPWRRIVPGSAASPLDAAAKALRRGPAGPSLLLCKPSHNDSFIFRFRTIPQQVRIAEIDVSALLRKQLKVLVGLEIISIVVA